MEEFQIPKGYKLNVRCYKEENGPITHLILSKMSGENVKYFLFEIVKDVEIKQISTSQTPTKLYQLIWS